MFVHKGLQGSFFRNTIYQLRRNSSDASKNNNKAHLVKITPHERIRNVGIIAHINAGKTTTSERIIHYSGLSDSIGEVDQGNTVTDYLQQERDRGITITSAAITYFWSKHKLNLIDTPGHVDFTIEVERSLSVLDGVVTILDSSAGVEAQTVTVWNQADRYKLSNIIYLNKFDKPTASLTLCLDDIKSKLSVEPLLLQWPIKENHKLVSIVDIINRDVLSWSPTGSKYEKKPILRESKLSHIVEDKRESLINKLSDMNDDFATHIIGCEQLCEVSSIEINKALRVATLEKLAFPVLVGSSYKNIGIQPLMDAMIKYLPSPLDRIKQIDLHKNRNVLPPVFQSFIGFVFKIIHDKMLGPLTFIRIYNGSLKHNMKLLNLRDTSRESTKRVYQAFADNFKEVRDGMIGMYNIAVASGLTSAKTGDILVESSFEASRQNFIDNKDVDESHVGEKDFPFIDIDGVYVPNIKRMEPVFYCSIEAPTMLKQNNLEHALECLSREDPSFTYEIEDMGQMIIKGMGKLHIEIVRDRIESEYGVAAHLGPLQITYRETFSEQKEETIHYQTVIDSVKSDVQMKIRIKSMPNIGSWSPKRLKISATAENDKFRKDFLKALHIGFASALRHGPLLGFEVINCDIELLEFKASNKSSVAIISSVASKCLTEAIKNSSPVLLEPMMLLEVVIPSEYNSIILSDLQTKRSLIQSTISKIKTITIRSLTPLSELSTYSEYLRVTTSGQGHFTMELYKYYPVADVDRHKIKIR